MRFKELETKEKFSNKYGNNTYVHSYCYYEGTEQISIYVKTGFGANEKTINELISEHKLNEWLSEFKGIPYSNEETQKSEHKISSPVIKPKVEKEKKERKIVIEKPKKEEKMIEEENEEVKVNVVKNDYARMRNIIFDTMIGVNNGTIDVEKAKVIATLSQTLINSVKSENDFLKITGQKKIQSMIN